MVSGKISSLGACSQGPAHSTGPEGGLGTAQLKGLWEAQPDFVINTSTSIHREPCFLQPLPPHCLSARGQLLLQTASTLWGRNTKAKLSRLQQAEGGTAQCGD